MQLSAAFNWAKMETGGQVGKTLLTFTFFSPKPFSFLSKFSCCSSDGEHAGGGFHKQRAAGGGDGAEGKGQDGRGGNQVEMFALICFC